MRAPRRWIRAAGRQLTGEGLRYVVVRLSTLLAMLLGSLILAHFLGVTSYGRYAQAIAVSNIVTLIGTLGQGELLLRAEISLAAMFRRVVGVTLMATVAATGLSVALLGWGYALTTAYLSVAATLSYCAYTFWVLLQYKELNQARAVSEFSFRLLNQVVTCLVGAFGGSEVYAGLGTMLGSLLPLLITWRRVGTLGGPRPAHGVSVWAGLKYAVPSSLVNANLLVVGLVYAAVASPADNASVRFVILASTASLSLARAMTKEQIQRRLFDLQTTGERWAHAAGSLRKNGALAAVVCLGLLGASVVAPWFLPSGLPQISLALAILSPLPLVQAASLTVDGLVQAERLHTLNALKEVLALAGTVLAVLLLMKTAGGAALAIVIGETVGLLVYVPAAGRMRKELSDRARMTANGPPTILFIDDSGMPGGGQLGLFRYLSHPASTMMRHNVLLFRGGPIADALQTEGIETHVLDRPFGRSGILRLCGQLTRRILYTKPDLVVSNSLNATLALGLCPTARSRQVAYVREALTTDGLAGGVRRAVVLVLLATRFRAVIFNSDWTRDTSPRWMRRLVSSRVCYPVSGFEVSAPVSREFHDDGPMHVLSLSRLSPWKGVHVLLAAARQVRRRGHGQDFHFDVAGAPIFGEESYRAKLAVAAAVQPGAIDLLGHRPDVGTLLARADVLAHCSTHHESFGQTLLQGMATGLILVATDCGFPGRLVRDGENGFLVPAGDAGALADALLRVRALSTAEKSVISQAAIRDAARFADSRTVPALQRLLMGLVAQRRSVSLGLKTASESDLGLTRAP